MSITSVKNIHPGHLDELTSEIEARIRKEPGNEANRWALVELLCIQGHWERALRQIQSMAKLSEKWEPNAHLVRGLIRAEYMRTEVFEGRQASAPVIDFPEWMQGMAEAIKHNALGAHEKADELRRGALDQAPTNPGVCHWVSRPDDEEEISSGIDLGLNKTKFEWIGDSDSRLGPICEVVVAGGYRWLAFADIEGLSIEPPHRILDLIWLPTKLKLRGNHSQAREIHCFLPARYYGTEKFHSDTSLDHHEARLLSRLTSWRDVGETGVFALGQKTWMTDGIDWPLLDIRALCDDEENPGDKDEIAAEESFE
ncbi:type VI secretion system accessory protein TagJ [Uliginosibacterium gangwonense]|uniref:type VI secretion system accessory protein TagJ n=1 Tax=Uliginosibacterium gangwonense TaxID=392736 RepID=UPI000360824F|nr:type VI secretion system accessory protein TagJ [Uliginosibacterium gangwonense]